MTGNVLSVRTNPEATALPTVNEAIQAWREDDNSTSLLELMAMSSCNMSHVSMGAMQFMSLRLEQSETPHIWVDHDPMTNLQEKQAMFSQIQAETSGALDTQESIRPVKTVTMQIPSEVPKSVAITGLGRHVDKQVRAAIASDLGLSGGIIKRAKINAANEFNPIARLALMPGVIGPFVTSIAAVTIDSWYYLHELADPKTPVEIALSDTDSLIMPKLPFENMLEEYWSAYLGGRKELRRLSVGTLAS